MIYEFLADGFEETEAISPLDIIRRAGKDVRTVSITNDRAVKGAHGITVIADMTASEIDDFPEMVILPGGMPGATNLYNSDTVKETVSKTYKSGGYIGAICAAPFILGQMGLLEGKRATCYPGFEEKLTGADYVNGGVVRDGQIITAAGMGVAQEFGLVLVAALTDAETAETIKRSIMTR